MRIGITYDLRGDYLAAGFGDIETAEFDRPDTIDSIEKALRALGHETDRIGNGWRLAERLVTGESWDLVFNIAEGLEGYGREAQVPALLELYQIPFTFSDAMIMSLSLHKGLTKRVTRDAGVPTADFFEVLDARQASHPPFGPPWFVKPVAEGTGKGVSAASVVRDASALEAACARLIDRFHQPVLVERLLEGREFTVGVWGTGDEAEAMGTLEVVTLDVEGAEKGIHSYTNKENCEKLVEYVLVRPDGDPVVAEAERRAVMAWRALMCRDAGRVDMRCDASGEPMLLEINPLAGLHPSHSDLPILLDKLGIPYVELIDRIVRSAARRRTDGPRRIVWR